MILGPILQFCSVCYIGPILQFLFVLLDGLVLHSRLTSTISCCCSTVFFFVIVTHLGLDLFSLFSFGFGLTVVNVFTVPRLGRPWIGFGLEMVVVTYAHLCILGILYIKLITFVYTAIYCVNSLAT